MAVLSQLSSLSKSWQWMETHQCAFKQVKGIVHKWQHNRCTTIDYLDGAPSINLVMDALLTGASGYISQGNDLITM